jgi:hypothetical protein
VNEHLKEFRELADMADAYRPGRGIPEPPDEETITRCIQVMLSRQCIYAGMHGLGAYYRVLSTPEYQGFFRKYFAAMALEFHHDTRSGLVALKVPSGSLRFDHQSQRLRKDETAVLIALRIAYEEAFRNKQFNEIGIVETTTNELFDKLGAIGWIEIEETRLKEILGHLKRKGVVDIGDQDPVERVRPLTILPGIEVVVPSSYIERVRMAAEAVPSAAATQDETAPAAPSCVEREAGEDPVGADEESL